MLISYLVLSFTLTFWDTTARTDLKAHEELFQEMYSILETITNRSSLIVDYPEDSFNEACEAETVVSVK